MDPRESDDRWKFTIEARDRRCDAFLVKRIETAKLVDELTKLKLIS